jgi:DNA modification methylase
LQSSHRVVYRNSRKLHTLADESIDLVVTSPPYPMIEMWDNLFAGLNPDTGIYLDRGDCRKAFESMHQILDEVWAELFRVMKAGAIACINIGDAVRSIKNRFQLFANGSRIQSKFLEIGFDVLPAILWRKQTNAPNKFMGSGMLPAGAYVTLEHEYILIFRKGDKRAFNSPEEKKRRRQSSYFWEERNRWFSDLWDFKGTGQGISDRNLRNRSAAYPLFTSFPPDQYVFCLWRHCARPLPGHRYDHAGGDGLRQEQRRLRDRSRLCRLHKAPVGTRGSIRIFKSIDTINPVT